MAFAMMSNHQISNIASFGVGVVFFKKRLCAGCRMGLRIVLADVDEANLAVAGARVGAIVGEANVITVVTDVSKLEDVKALKERALDVFGEVRMVDSAN